MSKEICSVYKDDCMTDYKVPSLFDCPEGGKHLFDQLDMDAGDCAEYGHCVKCGKWIDTSSGENETDRFEAEQEEDHDV